MKNRNMGLGAPIDEAFSARVRRGLREQDGRIRLGAIRLFRLARVRKYDTDRRFAGFRDASIAAMNSAMDDFLRAIEKQRTVGVGMMAISSGNGPVTDGGINKERIDDGKPKGTRFDARA